MAETLIDRAVRRAGFLDPPAAVVRTAVRATYRGLGGPGRVLKNLLQGTRGLGHPLHPALTDIPVGAWTVALVADIAHAVGVAVPTATAELALLIGIVGGVASAVTGYTDFTDTGVGMERRTAFLHGLLMTVSLALVVAAAVVGHVGGFGTSFGLLILGYAVLMAGSAIGGHLVFHRGTQVNRNAFAYGPDRAFVAVGRPSDFPEGVMVQVKAGAMFVLVVRIAGTLHAIDNACGHAGGPLHKGARVGYRVTCPWHASEFDLRTGRALCGPATAPQPALDVREQDDTVEVRLTHSLR